MEYMKISLPLSRYPRISPVHYIASLGCGRNGQLLQMLHKHLQGHVVCQHRSTTVLEIQGVTIRVTFITSQTPKRGGNQGQETKIGVGEKNRITTRGSKRESPQK